MEKVSRRYYIRYLCNGHTKQAVVNASDIEDAIVNFKTNFPSEELASVVSVSWYGTR
jgi:hypothetical protein